MGLSPSKQGSHKNSGLIQANRFIKEPAQVAKFSTRLDGGEYSVYNWIKRRGKTAETSAPLA